MGVFGAGILLIAFELVALFASALVVNYIQGTEWESTDLRAIATFFGSFAVCQIIIANALIHLL